MKKIILLVSNIFPALLFGQSTNISIVPLNANGLKYYYNYKYDSVGLMDESRNKVLPAIYPALYAMGEGYYAIQAEKNNTNKWFVVDKNGKKVNNEFYKLQNYYNVFVNGYAIVEIEGKGMGVVDKYFKTIIPYKYNTLGRSDKNLFYAKETSNSLQGVIDINNKIVIPFDYQELFGHAEGMMGFKKSKGFGYINLQNKIIIEDTFKSIAVFLNGYARVEINNNGITANNIRIINKNGEIIKTPETFSSISYDNTDGVFVVTKLGYSGLSKYYLFDAKVNKFIADKYKSITQYKDAIKVVHIDNTEGLINAEGKFVSPLGTDNIIGNPSSNYFKIKRNNKLGLVKFNKIVIEPTYTAILQEKGLYFIFTTDSSTDIYNSEAKLLKKINRRAINTWINSKNELHLFFNSRSFLASIKTPNISSINNVEGIGAFNKYGIALMSTKDGKIPVDIDGNKISNVTLGTVTNAGEGYYFHQKNSYNDVEILDSKFTKISTLYNSNSITQDVQILSGFGNGLCIIKLKNGSIMYIDAYGKPNKALKEIYKEANVFNNGKAFVKSGMENTWKLIDTLGKEYTSPNDITACSVFKDGFALVQNSSKLVGIINSEGKMITDFKYEEIGMGNSLFDCILNNKISILKSDGTLLVKEGLYDVASTFNNGYAKVKKSNKMGLINTKGAVVLPLQFDDLSETAENLVWAKTNNKLSLYNLLNGIKIADGNYDNVDEFQEGFCIVKKDGLFGLVDNTGKLVLPFQYLSLNRVMKGKISGTSDLEVEKIKF